MLLAALDVLVVSFRDLRGAPTDAHKLPNYMHPSAGVSAQKAVLLLVVFSGSLGLAAPEEPGN